MIFNYLCASVYVTVNYLMSEIKKWFLITFVQVYMLL